MTQQDLSKRTGLAASYLSRVENRRLEPSPRTLRRIAGALGVPMSELFQEQPAQLGTLQCVVTTTGKCIGEMLRSAHGQPADPSREAYSPRQLQLLRIANYLIETGGARLLDSLEVVLSALLQAERQKHQPRDPEMPLETGKTSEVSP